MSKQLIVPIDHSQDSWRAFDVALALADRSDRGVQLVHIAPGPLDGRQAEAELDLELQRRGPFDVEVTVDVRLSIDTVASELEAALLLHPDAITVMASRGKGRSAAIIGSVAEDVLQRTFGPIVLVGPNVEPNDFTGPVIVTVDGSPESEAALPLAAAWAAKLHATPWIINVAGPKAAVGPEGADVFETAYLARLTEKLGATSESAVQFDELHDRHPARAVVEYASTHDASLIIASSHGRSGLSRLAVGSVAAELVRRATCPVVVIRLPQPNSKDPEARTPMWGY